MDECILSCVCMCVCVRVCVISSYWGLISSYQDNIITYHISRLIYLAETSIRV